MRAVTSKRPLAAIVPLMLSETRRWHYAKATSLCANVISGVWRLSIVAVCVSNGAVAVLLVRTTIRLADELVLVLWGISASAVSLSRGSDG